MVIVKLMGGLGNQLFQYAAGRGIAERRGTEIKLDLFFLQDRNRGRGFVHRDYGLQIFNIREAFATALETSRFIGTHQTLLQRAVWRARKAVGLAPPILRQDPEPHYFDARLLGAPSDVYLDGYWQSERYFQDVAQVVREEFTFREGLLDVSSGLADRIRSLSSVCVNVRRRDFVGHPVHDVCPESYFLGACARISEVVADPHFFVFSDDVDWCRSHLTSLQPSTIVSDEHAGPGYGNYLQLTTLCRHFVIPNSTFGWWAAWLATHLDKVVICPKDWSRDPARGVRDIVPEGWRTMDNLALQ